MNRLINQFCNVSTRLFIHREEGVGNMIQGIIMAKAINGTPKNIGLVNWSKKLNVIVSFKRLFLMF